MDQKRMTPILNENDTDQKRITATFSSKVMNDGKKKMKVLEK
ncbi:hypothetical protein COLO4_35180 [Corchorus olitorius]|uniref:Uncharacterized protein n=1 Tax=Corchorus olitorius TaxID=93759 RepID=A0A1R3GHY5_9ROSI|nr:hypothetical protein COLO4_35180 [Corchorus olitorius]